MRCEGLWVQMDVSDTGRRPNDVSGRQALRPQASSFRCFNLHVCPLAHVEQESDEPPYNPPLHRRDSPVTSDATLQELERVAVGQNN